MPLDDYARVCYPASFAYLGSEVALEAGERMAAHRAPAGYPDLPSWLEWDLEGQPVGGYRNNAPQWYDLIGNTMFWNNVRDAVALHWWGHRLHDDSLIQKARRAVNLALAAPQHEGLFPTIYRFHSRRLAEQPLGNRRPISIRERTGLLCDRYFADDATSYHMASMSKTAAHLLRYYRLCETDPRILPYVRRYADFIVAHMDENGCVPAWFSADLQPNAHLRFNGESGVHVWFLADLYTATGDDTYLRAAKTIAQFITREILPPQRWLDTECFFSCGSKPMDFYDTYQHQEPRGTLSMIWAAEGFAALYRATGDRAYLEFGEQVLDYALVFQAVWHPHFIVTAYTFGGWNTDNGDAAWLDARQGEFADIQVSWPIAGQAGILSSEASLLLVPG
ncbi:MAG: glycoside hydrolase family 127 protein [Chloroflexi bacterium]|nr:glycoside hydrolase family 127 protein [Chloroflexota bacterium]